MVLNSAPSRICTLNVPFLLAATASFLLIPRSAQI